MSKLKKEYELYIKRQKEFQASPLSHYWIHQEERYVEPFRLFGNIYYIGDSWVCVHLIDTGDGLLMIDAGNTGQTASIIHNIWKLGFDPTNVKWIILSHCHLDHIGCANYFRRMFGTKIYMTDVETEVMRNSPEISALQDGPDITEEFPMPDEEIREGDCLSFGSLRMNFKIVGGHTPGCIAIFFDMKENEVVKRCGYFGGFGYNCLQTEYLLDIGDTRFQARRDYVNSINRVIDEKVDIMIGNHCNDVDLIPKSKILLAGVAENPFIDPDHWREYLGFKRDGVLKMIEEETQSA
ncbi:MAG: MBL fold metallo-hydrolase [Lachnospiraceae bacterium]|nr:MBL fold metallo-hydrolase [Lachnospiraceae bacterium]